ncbi:MAG TPA: ABC transporter permease [Candidatus Merdiplasma excrementigallinarum]|uniref:ABC transporter permease n=1 Tax=Candidatus Merdiplasma excrementigallinarum TaxID=2840864 RepID=A0A9D1NZV4_9FIRM|nr:ABC transporter permease [Candidatus Merdiplasma excrementigallinarum]
MNKKKSFNISSFRELLLVGVVLLLCVIWTAMNSQFMSLNNITNILRQGSYTAIAAVGMTMVIVIGEIDLSAGSLVCASGLAGAMVCKNTGNAFLAVITALAVGLLVGCVNGILCAYGKLPGFIATLASMTVLRGLAYIITGGNSVVWQSEAFTSIGTGYIGVIPIPVIIMCVVILFGYIVTSKLKFGRYIYAVGGNSDASKWSGIPVEKVKIIVYMIMGVLTALAGLIITARLGSGQPSAGQNFEMDCITAAVVGGTSMSGGRGKIFGTIVGVLLLTVLTNGMTLVGINTYWQQVLKGVIIVISVLADTRSKGKK